MRSMCTCVSLLFIYLFIVSEVSSASEVNVHLCRFIIYLFIYFFIFLFIYLFFYLFIVSEVSSASDIMCTCVGLLFIYLFICCEHSELRT